MMEINKVTAAEYAAMFPEPAHVFGSVAFSELNRHKAELVDYLVFTDDGKPRLGLVAGMRDGLLRSPFSAPFGGFEAAGHQNVSVYIDAVRALRHHYRSPLSIILPPSVYETAGSHLAAQQLALMAEGAEVDCMDFNYSIPLGGAQPPAFNRRSRSKLNKALRQGFKVETVADPSLLREIYDVILLNHTSLGYPVWMSFDDVMATTTRAVKADFFRLSLDGRTVAGAMIYHTAPGVRQLIYWGDDPAERDRCPMFMMADYIIDFYRRAGAAEFDLGPASKDGVPSAGLCFFKESIGARLTVKPSFILPPFPTL